MLSRVSLVLVAGLLLGPACERGAGHSRAAEPTTAEVSEEPARAWAVKLETALNACDTAALVALIDFEGMLARVPEMQGDLEMQRILSKAGRSAPAKPAELLARHHCPPPGHRCRIVSLAPRGAVRRATLGCGGSQPHYVEYRLAPAEPGVRAIELATCDHGPMPQYLSLASGGPRIAGVRVVEEGRPDVAKISKLLADGDHAAASAELARVAPKYRDAQIIASFGLLAAGGRSESAFQDALAQYQRTDPGPMCIAHMRLLAHRAAGHPDKALAASEELAELVEGDPLLLELQGKLLVDLRRNEPARAKLASALFLDPGLADASDLLDQLASASAVSGPRLHIRYEARPDEGGDDTAIDRTVALMRARLARQQVLGARVRRDGAEVVLELPGALDAETRERVIELTTRTAAVSLHREDPGAPSMEAIATHTGADQDARDLGITVESPAWADPDGARHRDVFLVAGSILMPSTSRFAAQSCGRPRGFLSCEMSGKQIITRYLEESSGSGPEVDGQHMIRFGRVESVHPGTWRTHHLRRQPAVPSGSVRRVDPRWNAQTNQAELHLSLDPRGSEQLAALTSAHAGGKLALLIDDVVVYSSVLHGPIADGRVTLIFPARPDGSGDIGQAEDIAAVIEAGALPARLVMLSSGIVDGPSAP